MEKPLEMGDCYFPEISDEEREKMKKAYISSIAVSHTDAAEQLKGMFSNG